MFFLLPTQGCASLNPWAVIYDRVAVWGRLEARKINFKKTISFETTHISNFLRG
jgi:hypothetical protein